MRRSIQLVTASATAVVAAIGALATAPTASASLLDTACASPPKDTGHFACSAAYGTDIQGSLGSLVIPSLRTGYVVLPTEELPDQTATKTVVPLNLTPVLKVGVITDSVSGTNTTAGASAQATSTIAGINLLNGLITADVLTAHAAATALTGHASVVGGASKLSNLVINGKPMPLDEDPNTVILIPNIATITINQVITTPFSITVRALDITLLRPLGLLPAGVEIQVANAFAGAI